MDDRWKCESEGLFERVNPRTGRTEWVEINPPCPDGHGEMRPDYRRCANCGFACRHWSCGECQHEERDPRHVCDSASGNRYVDPRFR